MKRFIQVAIFIGCSLLYFPAFAEQVRELSWDDLIPTHLFSVDLLSNLTEDQQDLVIWVINTLETLPKRGPETEELYKEVDEATADLNKAGIGNIISPAIAIHI